MKKTSIRMPNHSMHTLDHFTPDTIIREGCRRYIDSVRAIGVSCTNHFMRSVGEVEVPRTHCTIRLCGYADKALDIIAGSAGVTRSDVFRAFLYL